MGENSSNNTSLWYHIRTEDDWVGYIHSSLLSARVVPTYTPTGANTSSGVTTITSNTPVTPTANAPSGTCSSGTMQGSAAGLFSFDGKRSQQITIGANATIRVSISVTNSVGEWGVGALLFSPQGVKVGEVPVYTSGSDAFSYTTPTGGTYRLEVWGDSTHVDDYVVSWRC